MQAPPAPLATLGLVAPVERRRARRRASGSARPTGTPPRLGLGRAEQPLVDAPTTSRRCSSSAGSTTRCEVVDAWEADATRLGRDWVLAHVDAVPRSRGRRPRRRRRGAASLLEQAVAQHEAVGDPFGRARALLALGIVRRRARQKRPAREAIGAALGGFEQLGAATWVDEGARRARPDRRAARARRG